MKNKQLENVMYMVHGKCLENVITFVIEFAIYFGCIDLKKRAEIEHLPFPIHPYKYYSQRITSGWLKSKELISFRNVIPAVGT